MRRRSPALSLRAAARSAFLLALAVSAACSDPNVDTFEANKGAGPDPFGVIRGSVVYSGPAPLCDGTHVMGNVVLLLFEYDNPSPPDGLATSAANITTIPGDIMFASARQSVCGCQERGDCPAVVTASAPFEWPNIPQAKQYQVRGFFDTDGDFLPFFSVRNLPTRGDVSGGAVEDSRALSPRFVRISLGEFRPDEACPAARPGSTALDACSNVPGGSLRVDRLGSVVSGVTVTLGLPNLFERPSFTVGFDPERAYSTPEGCSNPSPGPEEMPRPCLSAEALLPPPNETDPVRRENFLYDPLPLVFSILQYDPENDEDPTTAVMRRAGLDYDPSAARFLLGYEDVNKNLIYAEQPADGHAILGSAGVLSFFPKIVLARRQAAFQTARREPRVLIIGTVRPTLFLDPIEGIPSPPMAGQPHTLVCPPGAMGCRATVNPVTDMPVVIPPVAVQLLNPTSLACAVPILGPATDAVRFQPRDPMTNPAGATRFVVCRELPVGDYGFNVVNLSGQAWSLPNDLGTPFSGRACASTPECYAGESCVDGTCQADPLNPASVLDRGGGRVQPLDSQSTVMTVYDPDPDDGVTDGCPDTSMVPVFNDANGDGEEDVPGLVEFCCAGVRHLCANAADPVSPPVDPPIPDFCCN